MQSCKSNQTITASVTPLFGQSDRMSLYFRRLFFLPLMHDNTLQVFTCRHDLIILLGNYREHSLQAPCNSTQNSLSLKWSTCMPIQVQLNHLWQKSHRTMSVVTVAIVVPDWGRIKFLRKRLRALRALRDCIP